ncbi:hypothetical protein D3C76_1123910 [compost metagenome]
MHGAVFPSPEVPGLERRAQEQGGDLGLDRLQPAHRHRRGARGEPGAERHRPAVPGQGRLAFSRGDAADPDRRALPHAHAPAGHRADQARSRTGPGPGVAAVGDLPAPQGPARGTARTLAARPGGDHLRGSRRDQRQCLSRPAGGRPDHPAAKPPRGRAAQPRRIRPQQGAGRSRQGDVRQHAASPTGIFRPQPVGGAECFYRPGLLDVGGDPHAARGRGRAGNHCRHPREQQERDDHARLQWPA